MDAQYGLRRISVTPVGVFMEPTTLKPRVSVMATVVVCALWRRWLTTVHRALAVDTMLILCVRPTHAHHFTRMQLLATAPTRLEKVAASVWPPMNHMNYGVALTEHGQDIPRTAAALYGPSLSFTLWVGMAVCTMQHLQRPSKYVTEMAHACAR